MVRESVPFATKLPNFLETLAKMPLHEGIEALTGPLLEHVMRLAGIDPDQQAKPEGEGPRMSFEEYHTRLFQIATGALGWTPNTAWSATAAEIIEAYKGRIEFVKAIFGAKNEDGDDTPSTPDFTRDEAGWLDFKLFAAAGGDKAR